MSMDLVAGTLSSLSFIDEEILIHTLFCSICPGRYMAENSLFIALCYVLHLLWIDKDGDGDLPAPRGVFGIVV